MSDEKTEITEITEITEKTEEVQEVCRMFRNKGRCRFNEKCRYQHSKGEKIPMPELQPRGICKNWTETGECQFENRCRYFHGDQAGAAAECEERKKVTEEKEAAKTARKEARQKAAEERAAAIERGEEIPKKKLRRRRGKKKKEAEGESEAPAVDNTEEKNGKPKNKRGKKKSKGDNDAPARPKRVSQKVALAADWEAVPKNVDGRVDSAAFTGHLLKKFGDKLTDETTEAYKKFLGVAFDAGVHMVPDERNDLGRHCFAYSTLIAGEFYFDGSAADVFKFVPKPKKEVLREEASKEKGIAEASNEGETTGN